MTPTTLLDEFIRHLRVERGLSENTCLSYGYQLGAYVAFLRARGLEPVTATRDDVLSCLERRKGDGLKSASLFIAAMAVRQFHRYLAEGGFAPVDPTTGMRLPRFKQRIPKPLDAEAMDRLLRPPRGSKFSVLRDHAMMEVLYATGMRVSELTGLGPKTRQFLTHRLIRVREDRGYHILAMSGPLSRFISSSPTPLSCGESMVLRKIVSSTVVAAFVITGPGCLSIEAAVRTIASAHSATAWTGGGALGPTGSMDCGGAGAPSLRLGLNSSFSAASIELNASAIHNLTLPRISHPFPAVPARNAAPPFNAPTPFHPAALHLATQMVIADTLSSEAPKHGPGREISGALNELFDGQQQNPPVAFEPDDVFDPNTWSNSRNKDADFNRLVRALQMSYGDRFSLFLVISKEPQGVLTSLRERLPNILIQGLHFQEPIQHLLDELRKRFPEQARPDVLVVSGLSHSFPQSDAEWSTAMVANLNAARNSFGRHAPYPLVLILDDERRLTVLANAAPDFFSIRHGGPYHLYHHRP